MTPELQTEIDRLKAIMEAHGRKFAPAQPALPDALARYERKMGVQLDQNLRDLWLLSNGSEGFVWFACSTDGAQQPYTFCSLDEIADMWPEGYTVGEPDLEPEDVTKDAPRIQTRYLEHPGWIPFADFGGGNSTLFFDTVPGPQGKYGQIIAYQHDPDAMYYIADNFLDFLRLSNDRLQAPDIDFFGD